MKVLLAGGKRAAERIIKGVKLGAHRLELAERHAALSKWRAALGVGMRVLEVWLFVSRVLKGTHVKYEVVRPVRMSPKEQRRHEVQEAFYKRYMEIGQRYYRGRGPRTLPRDDNLILLIGELEADVNNGGFDQYLCNKGRRRARSALAALRTVGAVKTARMLEAALARGVAEAKLHALDDCFYRVPEDLAVLTMRGVAPQTRRRR